MEDKPGGRKTRTPGNSKINIGEMPASGLARIEEFTKKTRSQERVNRNIGDDACAMKAKIIVTPKKAVLDPQGKTIQGALEHMGYAGIKGVHMGKYLEIEIEGSREQVSSQIDEACRKLLSNPVIEDYQFTLE